MSEPDPLIAVIRRNFEAATAAYGVEPPGDIGPLLREIRRLEVALADATKIECKCSGRSGDDVTPEEFDAMLDVGQPVQIATGDDLGEPAWFDRLPAGTWACVCRYLNSGPACTHCGRSKARSELAQQRAAAKPVEPPPGQTTACSYVLTSLPSDSRVTIRGTGTITVDLACPGRETSRQHIRLIDEREVRRGARQDDEESP